MSNQILMKKIKVMMLIAVTIIVIASNNSVTELSAQTVSMLIH
ncbi:MAG: hypothetical protein R8G33_03380 [Gammaproteobacteria bacterium]|nr:hypothetical protein [Gammaproteobacteria bacterium]